MASAVRSWSACISAASSLSTAACVLYITLSLHSCNREMGKAAVEFDAVTFTYLLRYVDDVPATLRELARVVRPGGTLAMLEFGLPAGAWRPPWELYVRVGLPAAGVVVSPGWGDVGRFLGPSIRDFWGKWPEPRLLEAWREAGIADVESRLLSVGGGIVVWGKRA